MGLPPGPPLPAAAQAALYKVRPFELLEQCGRRYGDLFTLRFPVFGTMVCAGHPEAIREIFTGDPDVMRVGEGNEPFRPIIGDNSISVVEGERHRLQRRLGAPLFTAERAAEHTGTIRDVALRAVERWPRGPRIAVHPELEGITLDVILRTVLGMEEGPDHDAMRAALGGLLQANTSLFASLILIPSLQRDLGPLTPWASFRRGLDHVDTLVYAHLARRRAEGFEPDRRDVLSRLLRAAEAEGTRMTDLEVRDALMTLVVAGYETTATSLCWALELLLTHPGARSRVLAELDLVTGGAPLESEHVARLSYLDAVVKEVLRLYPVVPIIGLGRKLGAPMRFAGHDLPAGVKLLPTAYLTHRRADLYPDPGRFQPERFLDSKIDPYAWHPFGGGARRCLGMSFALLELKVVLATLLGTARLALARRRPLRATVHGVTIAPEGGTHVIVEELLARRAAA